MRTTLAWSLVVATRVVIWQAEAAPQETPLQAAIKVAKAHVAVMNKEWAADQLWQTALTNRGERTDEQLEALYHKCITPGSRIVLGQLGGSISADPAGGSNYGMTLQKFLQNMCPDATVQLHNAAAGTTGSLQLGMCARSGLGQHVDVLLLEFSLNDYTHYHNRGQTESPAYELAVRAGLTSFQHAPAIFNLFFWGIGFQNTSAQEFHAPIARHYGLTGISLRDAVWPYLTAQRAPWAARGDVVKDSHHPTNAFHAYTGRLLALYVAERFLDWARRDDAAAALDSARFALPPPTLPPPLNGVAARLDLLADKLTCRWGKQSKLAPASYGMDASLQLAEAHSAEVFAWPKARPCVHFARADGSALVPVETRQGVLIVSNCHAKRGRERPQDMVMDVLVYALERAAGPDGHLSTDVVRVPVHFSQVVKDNAEAFIADIKPGRQTLEFVPNPDCVPVSGTTECAGFSGIITL